MSTLTKPWIRFRCGSAAMLATLVAGELCAAVAADRTKDKPAEVFLSGAGNDLFLALGLTLPLLQDGDQRWSHVLRESDALLVTVAATEVLKAIVREPRPGNPDSTTSFPSGHASAAFTVATMQSHYHPREAVFWFAGAAAIAQSRVALDRHRWTDVAAGAALGIGVARLEIWRPHGLVLVPFIDRGRDGHRIIGASVSWSF